MKVNELIQSLSNFLPDEDVYVLDDSNELIPVKTLGYSSIEGFEGIVIYVEKPE